MGTFSGWMFASDIDGTLIGDDCILRETDIKAIKEFVNEGGTFVLTTGRSADSARPFHRQLDLNTPVICNNGTVIRDFNQEQLIYTDPLDDTAIELIQYVLDQFPEAGIEIYGTHEVYFLRHNKMTEEHIARESIPVLDRTLTTVTKPWCKILFAIDPPLMEQFRRFIADSPFCDSFFFVQSAPFFYEASKIGTSKGKAVSYLADRLGVPKTHLATIGDNENDVKMLSITEHSFAVGNATSYAKDAAAHHTNAFGSTGGAVAEAIDRLKKTVCTEANPLSGWAIVTDLDGTLFKSADQIPEENLKAITYWHALGGQFTIATGRYYGSTLPIHQKLGLDTPFIYNNGAAIYDPRSGSYESVIVFGNRIQAVIADILERCPSCGIAGYDKESLILFRSNPAMDRHLTRQKITPKTVIDDSIASGICKILLTVEATDMVALKSALKNAPYRSEYCFTQSTDEFYEITCIGATKGGQLVNLCRLLGTSTDKLVAVGNNENDLTLLQTAPYSFAVADATADAKRSAKFVTDACGNTGAAIKEVVERMVNIILTEADNGQI